MNLPGGVASDKRDGLVRLCLVRLIQVDITCSVPRALVAWRLLTRPVLLPCGIEIKHHGTWRVILGSYFMATEFMSQVLLYGSSTTLIILLLRSVGKKMP